LGRDGGHHGAVEEPEERDAPLAAVIASGRIADGLEEAGARFAHGFTYAGNPLSAAVGLEVLDVLEEEG
jgi:adenosylmethionine-8-amino-7-oxononanoate aminotransferase